MARATELKDLEAYILGLVAENQPCSPYFIHKAFLCSPSLFFSGSAGAIYPAVKRLEGKGLLSSAKSGTRDKPSKSLTITDRGLKKFIAWYFDAAKAGDAGFDPLRGRISMLAALPGAERREALNNLSEIVRGRLAIIDGLDPASFAVTGMPHALEMERATNKAKLKLLAKWQEES